MQFCKCDHTRLMGNLGPVLKTQAEQLIVEQLISTMQLLLMLTVVICVAVTGSAGEDDTCAMASINVGKCCALTRIYPSDSMVKGEECKKMYITDKHPKTLSEVSTKYQTLFLRFVRSLISKSVVANHNYYNGSIRKVKCVSLWLSIYQHQKEE